jgi:hypothetical protein
MFREREPGDGTLQSERAAVLEEARLRFDPQVVKMMGDVLKVNPSWSVRERLRRKLDARRALDA